MKTTSKYETSYARLNPNQKEAVDQTEGPVMVLAGPGTGKTQILSTRIAKILTLDNQTHPENILCLTFTNAGRTAMRQRLIELTDTPTANSINIHTFHSFCNEIIQDRPEVFDYDLDMIGELETMEILQKVQNEIRPESPIFQRRYKETQLNRLRQVFDFIKKENLDPEKIVSLLQQYEEGLEDNPEFQYKRNYRGHKKGEIRPDLIEEEKKKIAKSIARIELFPVYTKLMQEEGYYDFSDMIHWVIDALETNEDLRYDLLEKYQYILVDEFQDTNGAQFRLTELLCGYENNNSPNIFVVGDDDQSIYRFQGANMKNLLDFRNKYVHDIKEVVLDQNYRSSQVILDGAQHLIEQNKNRLIKKIPKLKKDLKASNPDVADLGVRPLVLQMINPSQEYIHIAKNIAQKIADGTQPSDIAVLYPQHKYGNDFVQYLSALGVPFYLHKEMDLLKDPLAMMLIDLLCYLDSESRELDAYPDLLFRIFGFPFWSGAKDTGFMILNNYRQQPQPKPSFRSYVHEWVKSNADRENLKDWEQSTIAIYSSIEQLILDAQHNSLPVLMNKVISSTGLHEYVLEHGNKFWNLEVLKTLIEKCDEVYDKHPEGALQHLLMEIDLMRATGIAMPITKLLGSNTGVNLMSIHGSKGLEYKHVYLIACNENSWKSANQGNRLMVPKHFFDEMIGAKLDAKDPEEERRLFYVGITRAEESLTLSMAISDTRGKITPPLRFVTELQEGYTDLETLNIELNEDEIQELEWSTLTQCHDLLLEPSEEEILREKLKNFSMSVTGLYNYIECPVNFYYNNLLKVPSGRKLSTDFGNMMHKTLEDYYREAKSKGQHLGSDRLVEIYNKEVNRHAEKFMDTAALEEIEFARQELRNLYDQKIIDSTLDIALEEKFKHSFDQGLQITGIVDKIEISKQGLTVVDYKTGKPKPENVKGPVLEGKGAGIIRRYWLQGLFYKLLIENSPKYASQQINDVKFLFLNADDDNAFLEENVSITAEQLEYTMDAVYEAWGKIQNLEFSTGCNKPYCSWCAYQKTIKPN